MRNNHHSCSAMMISKTLRSLEDENWRKVDLSLIKRLLSILSVLLIIFTILYFTCLGCFLVLNDSTSWAAQTVTLSSEGPAKEKYPHSMGEYQLAEEEIERFQAVYNWYRHKDREDRFLMYNSLGKTLNTDYNSILYFTRLSLVHQPHQLYRKCRGSHQKCS